MIGGIILGFIGSWFWAFWEARKIEERRAIEKIEQQRTMGRYSFNEDEETVEEVFAKYE